MPRVPRDGALLSALWMPAVRGRGVPGEASLGGARRGALTATAPGGGRARGGARAAHPALPTFGLPQQGPQEELDALGDKDAAPPAQVARGQQGRQREERGLHRHAAHALRALAGRQGAPRQQGRELRSCVQHEAARRVWAGPAGWERAPRRRACCRQSHKADRSRSTSRPQALSYANSCRRRSRRVACHAAAAWLAVWRSAAAPLAAALPLPVLLAEAGCPLPAASTPLGCCRRRCIEPQLAARAPARVEGVPRRALQSLNGAIDVPAAEQRFAAQRQCPQRKSSQRESSWAQPRLSVCRQMKCEGRCKSCA